MSTETQKKKGPPQIVKVDRALKLAEQWVNNMTKPAEDELTEAELEGRPYKLGLGARVSIQTKRVPSDDPVERRLQAKFEAGRRKMAKTTAESAPSAKKAGDNDSDDDDDKWESKSQAFGKKKSFPQTSSLQAKKK